MFNKTQVLILPSNILRDDKPAVIVPANRSKTSEISYAQLQHLTCNLQRSLACIGVTKGSKVALVLPNGMEFVVTFLAVVHQRAVAALVNPQLKQDEYRQMFSAIQPSLVIVVGQAADAETPGEVMEPSVSVAAELGLRIVTCQVKHGDVCLRQYVSDEGYTTTTPSTSPGSAKVFSPEDVDPEDNALLLLTSGTTGPPKAVMLSHNNLLVAMRIIISAHCLSSTDRCLIVTPLFHIIGVGGSLLTTLFTGGCVVIPPSLSGSLWKTCQEFKITWFHAVPTLYRLILGFPLPDGQFPSTLRFLRSGGSDMAPDLYTKLQQLGPPILEVYGMTETAPAIFCNHLEPGMGVYRRLGYYPISEAVEVMILPVSQEDDQAQGKESTTVSPISEDPIPRLTKLPGMSGEICVRGKSVMAGYVNNPEANKKAFLSNGFFRTGDLGILHPDGYLQLVGRLKEIINKGGEKVSPSEIEHLVLSHEAVKEAACFRIADEMYGEEIGKSHFHVHRRAKQRLTRSYFNAGLAVVLHEGKQCKPTELKKHFRQNAALFKVPKIVSFVKMLLPIRIRHRATTDNSRPSQIVFTSSIPTNKTGKPMRNFLADEYAKGRLCPN